MEVKINVDEAMFKEILDKELSALTSEEIHEVISGVQDVVDKAIETLKNKYDVLIKDLIRDMIIQSISNSCGFRTAMENSIREYMWKEQSINN